jgi:hypothetical protein
VCPGRRHRAGSMRSLVLDSASEHCPRPTTAYATVEYTAMLNAALSPRLVCAEVWLLPP